MRLFFDANILTYIAIFEEFLGAGDDETFDECLMWWEHLQGTPLNDKLQPEVEALRLVYLIDEQAHFDWLCSDLALREIERIRRADKRERHYGLLERIIEHRHDVYLEEGRTISAEECRALMEAHFPDLPPKMENDALQYCEAELVEADYFLTADQRFISKAAATSLSVQAIRPSQLPFVEKYLRKA